MIRNLLWGVCCLLSLVSCNTSEQLRKYLPEFAKNFDLTDSAFEFGKCNVGIFSPPKGYLGSVQKEIDTTKSKINWHKTPVSSVLNPEWTDQLLLLSPEPCLTKLNLSSEQLGLWEKSKNIFYLIENDKALIVFDLDATRIIVIGGN